MTSGDAYELTVTLTAAEVCAAATGPDWDLTAGRLDLDMSGRQTIEVLRCWLARWGR
ncbi:hypothetical protein [Cellulomonas sp. ATA003]|uniref:hypothetical protein n=1 Tax=Cellulomonas sp. ATA003 TaxID=3073064 RepID=UPI0028736F45|nr:hypothetical protein [Cellulomonas sp. ATA003]WNB87282.1 hypothetical protein REH70_09380 [Cellulomonas sp. ATA003]